MLEVICNGAWNGKLKSKIDREIQIQMLLEKYFDPIV